jgi:hypothetical protein
MRAIAKHMAEQRFAAIPDEIRAMKRLWAGNPDMAGLLKRRELEAALFEQGLAALPPAPRPAAPLADTAPARNERRTTMPLLTSVSSPVAEAAPAIALEANVPEIVRLRSAAAGSRKPDT